MVRKDNKLRWALAGFAKTALLLAAILPILTTPAVLAQPKEQVPVKLRFKYDLNETLDKIKLRENIILLRPNTQQMVFLFVENTSPDQIKDLTAKLVKIEADGSGTPVAQVAVPTIAANTTERIIFAPPKPAPAPAPAGKPEEKKEPVPPGAPLAGPPFEFQVWFEQAKYLTRKEMLSVRIMEPREYVKVVSAQYDKKEQAIAIEVEGGQGIKDKQDIFGPNCIVNLLIPPDVNEGLIPVKTKGNYKQIFPPQVYRKAALRAEELKFEGDQPPKFGRVYLTVDDYERAFLFSNSFTGGDLPALDQAKPRLRLYVPRYSAPGPKLLVKLEVDNPPISLPRTKDTDPRPKPLLVRLALDLEGDGKDPFPVKDLQGAREQKVFFNPAGPGDGLVVTNMVRDWVVELNTTDLFGEKSLFGQILVYNTGSKKYERVALTNEQKVESEKILLFEKGIVAPLQYSSDDTSVQALFVLDSTGPVIEVGYKLEKQGTQVKGQPILIEAKVADAPPFSPITEVAFFVGPLTPQGTIPDTALKIPGKNFPEQSPVWFAELPIPTDKAGVFDVSVKAINQAGIAQIKTIKLILVDPGKGNGGAGAVLAKISGVVTVGTSAQPNVDVILSDPKDNAIKATTKTKVTPPGAFVFENVKPGVYQVTAANPALRLQGSTLVTVPEGVKEVKDVQVKMNLKPAP